MRPDQCVRTHKVVTTSYHFLGASRLRPVESVNQRRPRVLGRTFPQYQRPAGDACRANGRSLDWLVFRGSLVLETIYVF